MSQRDKDTKTVYWRVESADFDFDWRDRKKKNNKMLFHILMSGECESTENYG